MSETVEPVLREIRTGGIAPGARDDGSSGRGGLVALLVVAAAGLGVAGPPTPAAGGRFQATRESLQEYRCPDWFRDAKLGIYAHWGPYSGTGYRGNTDWYSHWMYVEGHPINLFHRETYGPVDRFGYGDFVPRFTAESFDAAVWAELFEKAGARFAGPVAEHADGFAMWDSALTEWDAKDKGPRRNVVAELERAVRRRGLRFMASFHHHWKWGWYPTWDPETGCARPETAGLYGPVVPPTAWGRTQADGTVDLMDVEPGPDPAFSRQWLAKIKEVVDRHRPDLIWLDNRMHTLDETFRLEMAAHYYNTAEADDRPVVLTYKHEDMPPGTAVLDLERNRMPGIHPEPWLTDTSIARNSWSYTPALEYYSTDRIVHDLVDIVSKNGCLLLNVAPHPNGTIPPEQRERLLALGQWLRLNGEAIYGTRPWRVFGEGPTEPPVGHLADLEFEGFAAEDVRFTWSPKTGTLYALALGWPRSGRLEIRALRTGSGEVKRVRLLGHEGPLEWKQATGGLDVSLPDGVRLPHAIALQITGSGLDP